MRLEDKRLSLYLTKITSIVHSESESISPNPHALHEAFKDLAHVLFFVGLLENVVNTCAGCNNCEGCKELSKMYFENLELTIDDEGNYREDGGKEIAKRSLPTRS